MAKTATNFKTMYDVPEPIATPTGTRFDKKYRIEYSKTGHKIIVADGTTDRYAVVQSHKEECEIANIIAKSKLDPSVLNRHDAVYGDFTKIPKSLAEFQNMAIGIKQEFYSLPVEIREKFNNSPEQYVAQYGTEKWIEDTGYGKYIKAKTAVTEETKEVTENAEQ